MVDPWEPLQPEYSTTVVVLEHFKRSLREILQEDVEVKLNCGADLLESFIQPGVWAPKDVSRSHKLF